MKCPRISTPDYPIECYEKECGLWNEGKNCCSDKVTSKELTNIQLKLTSIVTELHKIADRMPTK